jgi:hypothetical protein
MAPRHSMKKEYWLYSVAVGSIAALIVAGTMTFVDWRLNPGGLFRDERGTNWQVTAETAASWFFPVAAVVGVAAVLVFFAASRSRK